MEYFVLHGGGLIPATILSQTLKKATCLFYLCDVKTVRLFHKDFIVYKDEKILLYRNEESKQLSILRTENGLLPKDINVDERIGVV